MVVINDTQSQGNGAAHSWFSPSKAAGNLLCPGKVKACEGLPRKTNGEADRGTECHKYMEALLDDNASVSEAAASFKEEWQHEAVADAQNHLTDYMSQLIALNGDPQIYQEVCMELIEDPTVFGTTDILLWFPLTGHMVVLDYKFGMGEVFAERNPQMLTYACMRPRDIKIVAFEPITIDLAVIQPRVKNRAEVWSTTAEFVNEWKTGTLLPGIAAAKDPNAIRIPGEVQCKYCDYARQVGCAEAKNGAIHNVGAILGINILGIHPPVDAKPKELKSLLVEVSKADPLTCDAQLLSDFLKRIKFIQTVIDNAETCAINRMMMGEIIPDFKPVNANKREAWIDEEKADAFLQRKKLKECDRYRKSLITPKQARDKIDYKDMDVRAKKAFDALRHFPVGEPDYAPLSDPRPYYQAPAAEEVIEALEKKEPVDITSLFPSLDQPQPTVPADLASLF